MAVLFRVNTADKHCKEPENYASTSIDFGLFAQRRYGTSQLLVPVGQFAATSRLSDIKTVLLNTCASL